jgi:ABC-type transport system involved in multi-copper enzyme maturation permease subunit
MKNILAVARLTLKEGLGQKILYSVLIMALAVIFFAVLLSGFFMRDIAKIIVDFGLSAVSIGGLLVPFFITINLVAGDLENRTVFSLLAAPLPRPAYLIGKFIGLGLLAEVIMLILGSAGLLAVWTGKLLYGLHFFKDFSAVSYISAIFMSYMAVLLLNSLVILWCCLTTSSFLVTILTMASYIIGQTMDDIVMFLSAPNSGVPLSHTIKVTISISKYIFPNLAAFDFKQLAAHGIHIPLADILTMTAYAVAYSVAALSLAIIAFKNRDLA